MADPVAPGLVSLVGAGPGDPELLTRKGARRIQEADVLIHDQLVAPALIALAPASCEVVHRNTVGDGGQEAINHFLVEQSRLGRRVVRLKGGDPFVFGRGAEEAETLVQAGLPFEVVPGVTSGVGVPAYAGIPLTHRAMASHVTFVTGHEDPTKQESAINWEQLVRTGGTLVVFMGVRRLRTVVQHLVDSGAEPDMPVCAVHWGTTPMQRVVEGDLTDIVERVDAARLDHPALVIIGRCVSLRNTLSWFERRPLWGRRVLVTRAAHQAPALIEALRDAGAGVIAMPVLGFGPPTVPGLEGHAIDELTGGQYDWVVFTSANAVRFFWEKLQNRKLDLRAFAGARVAAVGPATGQALEDVGIRPDLLPEAFRAEGLVDAFSEADVRGKRFLLPRSEQAREVLPEALRRRGGIVDCVPVYRTLRLERSTESALHHVELADTVTFTSPSSVTHLIAAIGEDRVELLMDRTLVAIGPITARALTKARLSPDIVAETSTVEGLVAALVENSNAPARTSGS